MHCIIRSVDDTSLRRKKNIVILSVLLCIPKGNYYLSGNLSKMTNVERERSNYLNPYI